MWTYTRCLQMNGEVSNINKKYYILQPDGAPPPHFHRNVPEPLNRVLQQRCTGRAANAESHIHILYWTDWVIVSLCVV
jgi:hypothetical protein